MSTAILKHNIANISNPVNTSGSFTVKRAKNKPEPILINADDKTVR